MAEVLDAPATKEEVTTRASGLAKWMSGLRESLPNPSLGQTNEPEPTPDPKPADPVVPVPSPAPTEPVPKPIETPPPVEKPTNEPADEAKWPRSAKEWKNHLTVHKAKLSEYEKQVQERDAKIKEYEAKINAPASPEVQKEIELLKKENDEISKQLRLHSVTNHPRFKQYFDQKTTAALSPLKTCVTPDKLQHVTSLLQEPDSDRRTQELGTLMEDMNPLQQGRFVGVMNALDAIQAEREGEVSRANQDYEQMVAQAKAQKEQQKAHFDKLLDDTIKGMQDAKSGRPEYQQREGETEWNSAVQKRLESGKKLITGNLPPDVMFKAAFDAAAYPDVLQGYKVALGEIEKLKAQIASMTAANPKIETKATSTNGTGSEPAMPRNVNSKMDYSARWVKNLPKLGQQIE